MDICAMIARQSIVHRLIWADGSQHKITLDQGLGYWRIVSGIRAEFPFESDVDRQVGWLNGANIHD